MFQLKFLLTFAIIDFTFGLTVHTIHGETLEHTHKEHIPILKQDFQIHHEGYQYGFESANGIHVQETGYIKNKGDKEHETLIQQGQVTYHDEHGHPITLTYIADENGFQPQGAHLPTPPPHSLDVPKNTLTEHNPEELTIHEELNAQQYSHLLHGLTQ
ncbi:hypothetical protein Trydic_g22297 [Trypoxylus dichotomus]